MRCLHCGHDVRPPAWQLAVLFSLVLFGILYALLGARAIRDGVRERDTWKQLNATMRARLRERWILLPTGDTTVMVIPRRH